VRTRYGNEESYKENVGQFEVYHIPNPEFGKQLGGSIIEDWPQLFYTKSGSYFIFADDLEGLKRSILSTFRSKKNPQSQSGHRFLKFNFSLPKSIPLLMDGSVGSLKTNFKEWLPIFSSLETVSIKDNSEEENPSILLSIKWKVPGLNGVDWIEKNKTFLDSNIISGPIKVESKALGETFWAFQDQKLNAYVFNQDLKSEFQIRQGSKWMNQPQILDDQYNQTKSFLFTTLGAIYLVNDKGKTANGFPLFLSLK
jgi:hypothetical protein